MDNANRKVAYDRKVAYNRKEAAVALSVSLPTLDMLAHRPVHPLPFFRIGNRPMFPDDELRKWVHEEVMLASNPQSYVPGIHSSMAKQSDKTDSANLDEDRLLIARLFPVTDFDEWCKNAASSNAHQALNDDPPMMFY